MFLIYIGCTVNYISNNSLVTLPRKLKVPGLNPGRGMYVFKSLNLFTHINDDE